MVSLTYALLLVNYNVPWILMNELTQFVKTVGCELFPLQNRAVYLNALLFVANETFL